MVSRPQADQLHTQQTKNTYVRSYTSKKARKKACAEFERHTDSIKIAARNFVTILQMQNILSDYSH